MKSEVIQPCVHDLILLGSGAAEILEDAPEWVGDSIRRSPWVVVRRERAACGLVAVGIRGATRDQRWPAFIPSAVVKQWTRPQQLRSDQSAKSRRSIPAMRALHSIEQTLSGESVLWGPGGSVGYELASGAPTVSETSDLDLVLYSSAPINRSHAQVLVRYFSNLSCRVDAIVETGICAFSLSEFAHGNSRKILARTASGSVLVADPWAHPWGMPS